MAGEKQFFLGIGGQQTGPHTDEQVVLRIRAGKVRPDTLIWYEGLPDWQRIDSIAFFKEALEAGPEKGASPSRQERSVSPSEMPKPVFSSREAVFFRRRGPSPRTTAFLAVGAVVGLIAYLYVENTTVAPVSYTPPIPPPTAPAEPPQTREARLKKADSQYLLDTTVIPEDFLALIREDPTDAVGLQAVAQLELIYKKKRRPRELAQLYMAAGRPGDAVGPLMDEKAYSDAEQALAQAYEKETDRRAKRDYLLKQIELLTGPLQNTTGAVERVRLLEKEFPAQLNPYAYYLLTPDRKMADIFDRTSFYFVESLVNHMKAEFPQMKLAGRPVAAVVKERPNAYRVVANYKGDVELSFDNLRNIRFEYWLVGAEWNLVATNITKERTAWAKTNRQRHRNTALTAEAMLAYLEGVVRAQFPQVGLHERLAREKLEEAARQPANQKNQ